MSEKLTPKQAMFIKEFVIDKNITRAAIAAGVPVASAAVTGSRWMRKKIIQEAIAVKDAQVNDKCELEAVRVRRELAKLCFYDPRKLYHEDGRPKEIVELDDITVAAIEGVDVAEERCEEVTDAETGQVKKRVQTWTKKFKLANRGQNLERAAKILGIVAPEKHEHSGRITLEDLVCSDDGRQGAEGGAEEAA